MGSWNLRGPAELCFILREGQGLMVPVLDCPSCYQLDAWQSWAALTVTLTCEMCSLGVQQEPWPAVLHVPLRREVLDCCDEDHVPKGRAWLYT